MMSPVNEDYLGFLWNNIHRFREKICIQDNLKDEQKNVSNT